MNLFLINNFVILLFRLGRQGGEKPLVLWLQTLQPFINEWASATTTLWQADGPFQQDDFQEYDTDDDIDRVRWLRPHQYTTSLFVLTSTNAHMVLAKPLCSVGFRLGRTGGLTYDHML